MQMLQKAWSWELADGIAAQSQLSHGTGLGDCAHQGAAAWVPRALTANSCPACHAKGPSTHAEYLKPPNQAGPLVLPVLDGVVLKSGS